MIIDLIDESYYDYSKDSEISTDLDDIYENLHLLPMLKKMEKFWNIGKKK
jgi:hypothetical protein